MSQTAPFALSLALMLTSLYAWSPGRLPTKCSARSVLIENPPVVSEEGACWAAVPLVQGHAEITVEPRSSEELLLLVSAFAPPQTSTKVRLEVTDASAIQQCDVLAWNYSKFRFAPRHTLLNPVPSPPSAGERVRERGAFPLCSPPLPNPLPHRNEGDGTGNTATCPVSGSRLTVTPSDPAAARVILWPASIGRGGPFDYLPIRCRELCRGHRTTVVWDEDALDGSSADFARLVVELIERSLLPAVESAVGPCADVDGDHRLTIAVSPRVNQMAPGQTDLSAFVRAADFRMDGESPWSNRADLVYLAPHVDARRLPAILAHELVHVAQFSGWRQRFDAAPWPLPDWLLEGQAHAVEVRLTGRSNNLEARLTAFCSRPEACPLVIADATASGRWREPGCRGAAAAFCLWLSDSYGEAWWRRVTELVSDDDESWRREFGAPFPELYRQWTIDLAVRGLSCDPAPNAARLRPGARVLTVNGETLLTLSGAATAYNVLPATEGSRLRVRVQSDGETSLQLTLVRCAKESRDVNSGWTSARPPHR